MVVSWCAAALDIPGFNDCLSAFAWGQFQKIGDADTCDLGKLMDGRFRLKIALGQPDRPGLFRILLFFSAA